MSPFLSSFCVIKRIREARAILLKKKERKRERKKIKEKKRTKGKQVRRSASPAFPRLRRRGYASKLFRERKRRENFRDARAYRRKHGLHAANDVVQRVRAVQRHFDPARPTNGESAPRGSTRRAASRAAILCDILGRGRQRSDRSQQQFQWDS